MFAREDKNGPFIVFLEAPVQLFNQLYIAVLYFWRLGNGVPFVAPPHFTNNFKGEASTPNRTTAHFTSIKTEGVPLAVAL